MSIGSTSSHKADVDYHTKALPAPVVELPPVPKYPCPFITDVDVERYLKPLYSTGWGISRVPAILSPPKGKPVPAATQLSKKISLPNSHLAEVFIEDAKTFIIEPENVIFFTLSYSHADRTYMWISITVSGIKNLMNLEITSQCMFILIVPSRLKVVVIQKTPTSCLRPRHDQE